MSNQPGGSRNLDPALASNSTLAEAQRAVQDQRLLAIFEVTKILVTESDPENMLPKLLSCLIETLEAADAGVLLLHDPADGRLRVKAAQGYELTTLGQIRLAPGESLSGRVFLTGQAELCLTPEATAAAMASMTPTNREIFGAATSSLRQPLSAVCVPLITDQKEVGVLMLENLRQPGSFTDADLPFLQAVADLIALSIENARLNQELHAHSLDEANRLKAELISTLAHEMRTPLASIKGYSTALLMEEATFSPETQREFLQIIDEECDILQDLIHDLLESSIIDAGLLRLEPQPVKLPRLVQSVLNDIAHRSPKHRFLVGFPAGFPIVDADPDRIAQVLRNLLDNAVKYSPGGGLVIVRGEVGEDKVVISVADQGVGIAPEHMNRLFEKFFRVKSGLGRRVVGSGLGLPIARTIVESHGGHIWAESQVGQGTTLYFTLPLRGQGSRAEEEAE
jgi:signal transduction histidine kinase